MQNKIRIAQMQLKVYTEKEKNIEQLEHFYKNIAEQNVDLLSVGEMFNCPYDTSLFRSYAELDGGKTWQACSAFAKRHHIYFSAGSIPEIDAQGKVYNTAYIFDREGKQIAKYRKTHLFDIDVEGGQSFHESDTLSAGKECVVFDTEFCRMGIMICFDGRFPELARLMVNRGAKVILCPAAFNRTTGPAHWDLMYQSRALDNQCYMIGTSSARDESSSYVAWGHSLVVSPWGEIIQEMDEKEGIIVNELDLDYVNRIRKELPFLKARRADIYSLEEV